MTDEETQQLIKECDCSCQCVFDILMTDEQEELLQAAIGRNGIVRMRGKSGEVTLAIVRKSISNTRNQQQ